LKPALQDDTITSAVEKIRVVLGTDPLKATAGTVRRDFGNNIMINAAHASDSSTSYKKKKTLSG